MPPLSPPHPGMLNLCTGSQWSRGLFRAMWWMKNGPWNQERSGSGPNLLLSNSVTLGKLFQISELTFPHLQNETNYTRRLVLWVVNDIQYMKYLTHKYSTNLGLFPSLLLRVAHISQETHLDQSEQHYITNAVFKSPGNRILQFSFSKNIKGDWNHLPFFFSLLPSHLVVCWIFQASWLHIGSLLSTMLGVFTPGNSADTTNQGPFFWFPESWFISTSQFQPHSCFKAILLNSQLLPFTCPRRNSSSTLISFTASFLLHFPPSASDLNLWTHCTSLQMWREEENRGKGRTVFGGIGER